ncbi:hypothetical protein Q5H91_05655 [Sphingomonas sp. KR1UV-12]|uniref:Uncharacterized protein n=1 Tax=Sphingomonas aurea TaxID=3063994 RepID=A0ABT9EI99_9SPHN|nr:hypothetical protein [Sphingomonas sp. KR1UV-12]MDP1026687.1 hypothetical protein [Sphingomonas sp. KR1UV-12]
MRFRSKRAGGQQPQDADTQLAAQLVRLGGLDARQVESVRDLMATDQLDFAAAALRLGVADRPAIEAARASGEQYLAPGDDRVDAALIAAFTANDSYLDGIRVIRARLLQRAATASDRIAGFAIIAFDMDDDLAVLGGNLAILMARSGSNTLLIDLDGDRASAIDLFADAPAAGHCGSVEAIPGLSLLRLSADRLRDDTRSIVELSSDWPADGGRLLALLHHDADRSAIATASLLRDMQGVVLLLRRDVTEYAAVRAQIDALDASGVTIEGCVIL